jgi:acetyltransferase-like isoleucine patch superfamily enzyme
MGVLKTPIISVGSRVFVGSFCFIAECVLRDEVRIAHHSVVQGGPHTHGFERLDIPMSEQAGAIRAVSIGPNVWIGAGARILSDVAPGTMVGAGAVVTKLFEENAILVGVPARCLRLRGRR